jgi:catechol-2,3-dioxygenase
MSQFYQRTLGMEVAERIRDDAVFLRLPGGDNHHDLGLIKVGSRRQDAEQLPGLYHTAWEVGSFEEFRVAREQLIAAGVLIGESEHGTSLSLYAKDPEGNEFEVCWILPRTVWSRRGFGIRPLELNAEAEEWGREPSETP